VITEMIDQVMSAHPDISLFHIGADEVCASVVLCANDNTLRLWLFTILL